MEKDSRNAQTQTTQTQKNTNATTWVVNRGQSAIFYLCVYQVNILEVLHRVNRKRKIPDKRGRGDLKL
jgi:hypothetical protein